MNSFNSLGVLLTYKAVLRLLYSFSFAYETLSCTEVFHIVSKKPYVIISLMKRMMLSMRINDRITLDRILEHKAYFDQKLITIVENLESNDAKLNDENKKLKYDNQDRKYTISNLNLKIKDLESQKYTINQRYLDAKNENDEILKYLKKLEKEIEEVKKENEKNQKIIEQQEKNIKKQETIINQIKYLNSTNSNLPSSMDILSHTKPKTQVDLSGKTVRKRGGQKQHTLHKSRLAEKPDYIITKKVKKAPTGALPVKNESNEIKYFITQEVDLQLKSIITETRYYIDDKARELDKDTLSKYAINPLIYSGNFKATTVYLNQKGTIPLQRLCDMLGEISKGSIQLSASTINNWCIECHKKSKEIKEEILKDILAEALIHVDETGMKVNGEQYWIHTMTNGKGSIFLMTKKRGDKERGAIKLLELYNGVLVHDHFCTYQYLTLCQHAECNAHIDRYLRKSIDFDHHEESKEMLELMHEMLHRKNELIKENKTSMPSKEISDFEMEYIDILKRGLKNYKDKNPTVKKKYEPEFVKTFSRMLVFKEDHLRFIKDFKVPYTNNNAERQCRAVKAKKNISGQFVSESSGEAYVSILSLLQTAKLKNENALEMLEHVFH